jgi:transcriptional repressor NrdR
MICPKCKNSESQVIDSREVQDGIRRRRECQGCKARYTTYERIEIPTVTVLKKDGTKERFTIEKIRRGIRVACKNRPVSPIQIDEAVNEVEQKVYMTGKDEICSTDIGNFVGESLQRVDRIAYVRFISVYQSFSDVAEFTKAINTLN